jgi:hypothetical protein
MPTAMIQLFRGAPGLTDLPIDTRLPRGEQERPGLAKANRPGRLHLEEGALLPLPPSAMG